MRLRPHPDRAARLAMLESLDPRHDHREIFRRSAMSDLAWEMRFGWNLAFYRAFAVPRMAELLVRTGEMTGRPVKRAYDTGLVMYELFEHGVDHPRGREVIRRLNRMHHRWDIADDDYRYVLAAFAVVPERFVAAHGWRPFGDVEREAAYLVMREIGAGMAIPDIPGSFAGLAAYLDDYESREVRHSAAAEELMAVTLRFAAARLPGPLRPRAAEVTGAFLDARLRAALGLPEPRATTRALLSTAFAARRAVVRRTPPAAGWFTAGMPNAAYPEGYALADLGPDGADAPGEGTPVTPVRGPRRR
jgi:uncharacterized protein (DUF2236 family)